jgi:hypothetical protein
MQLLRRHWGFRAVVVNISIAITLGIIATLLVFFFFFFFFFFIIDGDCTPSPF